MGLLSVASFYVCNNSKTAKLTESIDHSPFRTRSSSANQIPALYGTLKGSLQCSQDPATYPNSETDQSNQCPTRLYVGLPSGLITTGFPIAAEFV
jgi:hypothetical protein